MANKKRYFPSSFLVIIGLMMLFVFISWIGSSFTNSIHPIGIFDIFPAIWHGFIQKAPVILFVFAVGGILGILTKLQVIDAGIGALVDKLGDKVFILIPILMVVFGLGGSTYGMWEETIAFFPILIPVFKKAGYGPFTAVLVILIGAGTGCLASTINPFAIGIAFSSANTVVKNASINLNITPGIMQGSRWLVFIIYEIVGISLVMFQANKYKKNDGNVNGISNVLIEKAFPISNKKLEFTMKRKISLSLFIFAFMFMIFAYLPWGNWISNSGLTSLTNWWNKYLFWIGTSHVPPDNVALDGNPSFAAWGYWYFISVAALFFIVAIAIFFINFKDFVAYDEDGKRTLSNKEEVFIGEYLGGVKDVLSVSLLIAVAGGLGVILQYTGIGTMIANSASGLGHIGFIGFALVIFIISLALSLLIPSTSGFAGAFIPVFTGICIKAFHGSADQTTAIGLVVLAFVIASGLSNLVSPTSAALMGYTNYSKVSYPVWLRETWKITIIYLSLGIALLIAIAGIAQMGVVF